MKCLVTGSEGSGGLIVYETDDLEPPLEASMPKNRYVVGENGEPIVLPHDDRMITTRGFLNALSRNGK